MSWILRTMIVFLLVAATALPVMAEEPFLSLSGQLRGRVWYLDEGDGNSSTTYVDQRLRVFNKISVTDGLSLNIRMDFGEQDWGSNGGSYAYGREGYQCDRAYLDWKGDAGHFQFGQRALYVGHGTVDSQSVGAAYTSPGDIPIMVFYHMFNSNETKTAAGTNADTQVFGVVANMKTDSIKSSVFVSALLEGYYDQGASYHAVPGFKAYLLGGTIKTKIGAVNLDAELDFITGDGGEGNDPMALQTYIDASFVATNSLTLGTSILYAMAADDDELQITYFGDRFNGWDPLNYGPFEGDDLLNHLAYEGYDFTGQGAGVMSIKGYAKLQYSESTCFMSALSYSTTEDDDVADDDFLDFNIAVSHKLTDNVTVATQFAYSDQDSEDDADISYVAGLIVNF